MPNLDFWIVLTNIGLIVVTGAAILSSIHEAHRHEEHIVDTDERRDEHLIELALKAVEREHEHTDQ